MLSAFEITSVAATGAGAWWKGVKYNVEIDFTIFSFGLAAQFSRQSRGRCVWVCVCVCVCECAFNTLEAMKD